MLSRSLQYDAPPVEPGLALEPGLSPSLFLSEKQSSSSCEKDIRAVCTRTGKRIVKRIFPRINHVHHVDVRSAHPFARKLPCPFIGKHVAELRCAEWFVLLFFSSSSRKARKRDENRTR